MNYKIITYILDDKYKNKIITYILNDKNKFYK